MVDVSLVVVVYALTVVAFVGVILKVKAEVKEVRDEFLSLKGNADAARREILSNISDICDDIDRKYKLLSSRVDVLEKASEKVNEVAVEPVEEKGESAKK